MLINELINYRRVIFQSLVMLGPLVLVTGLTRLFITNSLMTCISNDNVFA